MQDFKWIELRPGSYKTVPLTDDRPAVALPSKPGIPNLVTRPSWVSTVNKLMPEPGRLDPTGERRATDIMVAERAKELRTSARARNWEENRKKEWKANKPAYLKARKGGVQ